MTVTVNLSGEKPTPEPTVMAPADPEPNSGILPYLKSTHGLLKIAEIVFGVLVLVFICQRYWLTPVEIIFIFLSFNASVVMAFVLVDNLNEGKVRNLVRLDISCEKLELRYYPIVALLYYIMSFLALTANTQYNYQTVNILAGVVGILASIAYVYDWWLLYRKRLLERMESVIQT